MKRNLSAYIIENFEKALDNHSIQPYYQPVIRTLSRHLCSFEALARWIDPEIGMIYPDEFIPVLEKNQKIHLLDACIIRQVCARIRVLMERGEQPVPVSVNLSRLDFTLCDIFSVFDSIVQEYRIPHECIYVEITESLMAEQKDRMMDIVARFRNAGYQVWMDDFGSGYSSLNVLKEFSFDELKLDMVFVSPWTQKSKLIASSIIQMAKRIDIHTLAEGVETEEQFLFYRGIGCEKVQGYYFGKPMPYDDAIAHLRQVGIKTELPSHRKYYEDIGRIDLLSAVPFMTREERTLLSNARQLNSIPLAIVEFMAEGFRILFHNTAFEKIAEESHMFAVPISRDIIRDVFPFHLLSERIMNLMDSTRSGEIGRMHLASSRSYYEITAKCISTTIDRYTVLVQMTDLAKDKKTENARQLDEYLKQIYSTYERITLVNIKEDIVTPLYISTRDQLVSNADGVMVMAREYAEKFIFPDDRKDYLEFVDPKLSQHVFDETGRTYLTRFFRSSVRHGSYAWKAYTILRLDDALRLLMIANVHVAMKVFESGNQISAAGDPTVLSPEQLWHNLQGSTLLPMFWKDKNRRFLGATRAFMEYYGFKSEADFVGRNDEELGWHIHPDAYMNDEMQVLKEGITTRNIPGLCMNEGENREIFASKAPIYDTDGEIAGLMGYFIDRKLLTQNDVRGTDGNRRDLLTGLLNSRGIAEETAAFRDEYYLRGLDFVRIHIAIDDFSSLNETFGFDFGDRVMTCLGQALKKAFGRTCAVGRYSGQRFIVLHQVQSREEVHLIRTQIKEIGASVKEVDGIPVTLYLSVGFVLFSEYLDLEEQARRAEIRLLADTDKNVPAKHRMANASEIFQLFENLPILFAVYHVTQDSDKTPDAVLYYVNRLCGAEFDFRDASRIGRSVHDFYASVSQDWLRSLQKAAWHNTHEEGIIQTKKNGKKYFFAASQIIYPGYCAVIYRECTPETENCR